MRYTTLLVSISMTLLFSTALFWGNNTLAFDSTDDSVSQAPSTGETYYVSRNGTNENGLTWETAWNELDQINWAIIRPGDVINIDGDEVQMWYTTELQIGQSGLPNNPIVIQVSPEEGRNGKVVFFGGREQLLPFCGELDYDNSKEDTFRVYGIQSNDHSYLTIDGQQWGGISIHGYSRSGIRLDRGSRNITVRNVEIYNNGVAEINEEVGGWQSNSPGVYLGGQNMVFQYVNIHDNGQDSFQSLWDENNLRNFHLDSSWLHNERQHPVIDESANWCTHTDGIHIYAGGIVSGLAITNSVIGPGLTNNLILGQTRTSSGSYAHVQDVLIENTLLMKAADNNILGYTDTDSRNWVLDHVTVHCPNTKTHCIRIRNSDHSVTNSIFVGAKISFFEGLDNYENNCQWETEGFELGIIADPQFTDVSDTDYFSLDDYSLQPGSPCQNMGSSITSVNQLLTLPD